MNKIKKKIEEIIKGYDILKKQLIINLESIKSENFSEINKNALTTNELLTKQEEMVSTLNTLIKGKCEKEGFSSNKLSNLFEMNGGDKLAGLVEELIEKENEVRNQLKINSELTIMLRDIRSSFFEVIANVAKEDKFRKNNSSGMLNQEF